MLRRLAGESLGQVARAAREDGPGLKVDPELAPLWLAYRLACDPEARLVDMTALYTTLTLDQVDLLTRGYEAIATARIAASKAHR